MDVCLLWICVDVQFLSLKTNYFFTGNNFIMKELEGKIRELGEAESVEREALKEEISLHIEQKVGHLASEVSSA